MIIIIEVLTGLLSLTLMVVAGLGVMNTVVLDTRERVHDLGVYKALGMTAAGLRGAPIRAGDTAGQRRTPGRRRQSIQSARLADPGGRAQTPLGAS